MQIDTQTALRLAEAAGQVCFFDLESTGTHGDYNSILVATVKGINQKPRTFIVDRPGNDKSILAALRDEIERYTIVVTFYGRMFDFPLLQTRLLHHNMRPLQRRHHLDCYFAMKSHTLTSRRSQAHFLRWFQVPQQKMDLSPEVWNAVLSNPTRGLDILRKRCESDCAGLEALYKRMKHLVRDVTLDD